MLLNFIEFSLYHKGLKSPKCLISENLVYLISVTKQGRLWPFVVVVIIV